MKLFAASFVLILLAMGIIACNSTTQGKKDERKLNSVAASSNAVKYQLVTDAIRSPVQW